MLWNGTALTVKGTVYATAGYLRGLDIEDSAGNVILSSGSTLQDQLGGGNLCADAGFDARSSEHWQGNIAGWEYRHDVPGWFPTGGHAIALYQPNASTYPESSELYSDMIPVIPGRRYEYQAKTGAHRCKVEVFVYWFNASNVTIGYTTLIPNNSVASGGTSLEGWLLCGGFGIAPAGTLYGKLMLRKTATIPGYTDSWMFATQAYFGEAATSQTTLSRWSPSLPGGRFAGLSQITLGNVSTYIDGAAIGNAQINGNIYSENYYPSGGTAGWLLDRAGNLTAKTGTFSGDLDAAGGTFSGKLTANAINAVSTVNIAGHAVTVPTYTHSPALIAGVSASRLLVKKWVPLEQPGFVMALSTSSMDFNANDVPWNFVLHVVDANFVNADGIKVSTGLLYDFDTSNDGNLMTAGGTARMSTVTLSGGQDCYGGGAWAFLTWNAHPTITMALSGLTVIGAMR